MMAAKWPDIETGNISDDDKASLVPEAVTPHNNVESKNSKSQNHRQLSHEEKNEQTEYPKEYPKEYSKRSSTQKSIDNMVISPMGSFVATCDTASSPITLALYRVEGNDDEPTLEFVDDFPSEDLPDDKVDTSHISVSDEGFIAFVVPTNENAADGILPTILFCLRKYFDYRI